MHQAVRRWLTGAVVGVSIVSLSGCGTLFYPERKGQMSGDIDPVVAIANGVGLLFFIVSFLSGHFLRYDAMDVASLEKILSDKAGQPVSLESELIMIEEMDNLDEALAMVRMSGVLDEEKLSAM